MKGKYRITVQNKRIRYDFEVKRNLTIIRGDSATGKTALVQIYNELYHLNVTHKCKPRKETPKWNNAKLKTYTI